MEKIIASQTIIALLQLCTLTNNCIKAMDHKRWSLSTHPSHPNNRPFPQATQAPYEYNPKLYENDFRNRLKRELYHLKYNLGKSDAHLNIYKKNLLPSMERRIIEITLRSKYYPQMKAIEWKKS